MPRNRPLVGLQRNIFFSGFIQQLLSFSLTEVLVWSRRHRHLPLVGQKVKERSHNVSTNIHFLIYKSSDRAVIFIMYRINPFVSAQTNVDEEIKSLNDNNRYLVKLVI